MNDNIYESIDTLKQYFRSELKLMKEKWTKKLEYEFLKGFYESIDERIENLTNKGDKNSLETVELLINLKQQLKKELFYPNIRTLGDLIYYEFVVKKVHGLA